jgi:hypothetical protein
METLYKKIYVEENQPIKTKLKHQKKKKKKKTPASRSYQNPPKKTTLPSFIAKC